VTFPKQGRWRIAVDEGFGGMRHQFGAITIGDGSVDAPATPAAADDGLAIPLLAAGIAGILAAGLTVLLTTAIDRRRTAKRLAEGGPSPASS
jgi:hypothetical protein